jgi:hypothetical protein
MENTLDLDYKGIDKQFKEQLIKTKVCFHHLFLHRLLSLSWCWSGDEVERMLIVGI